MSADSLAWAGDILFVLSISIHVTDTAPSDRSRPTPSLTDLFQEPVRWRQPGRGPARQRVELFGPLARPPAPRSWATSTPPCRFQGPRRRLHFPGDTIPPTLEHQTPSATPPGSARRRWSGSVAARSRSRAFLPRVGQRHRCDGGFLRCRTPAGFHHHPALREHRRWRSAGELLHLRRRHRPVAAPCLALDRHARPVTLDGHKVDAGVVGRQGDAYLRPLRPLWGAIFARTLRSRCVRFRRP